MIRDVTLVAGHLRVTDDAGNSKDISIKDVLRAADIPALTYSQISSIKAIVNLMVIVLRTLIARGILDESFLEEGDYNLDDLIEAIENMGGDYGEPDLTGSET